jgi:hypothetical protein
VDKTSFSISSGGGTCAMSDGSDRTVAPLVLLGAVLLWRSRRVRRSVSHLVAQHTRLAALLATIGALGLFSAAGCGTAPDGSTSAGLEQQRQTQLAQRRAELIAQLAATRHAPQRASAAAEIPPARERDDDEKRQARFEADPVASMAPALGDMSRKNQLVTLKWMRTLPEGRIAAAFPHLMADRQMSPSDREVVALDLADAMIELLELDGVTADDPPPGFVAVRIDDAAPPAGRPSIEFLETYNPHPGDPYAMSRETANELLAEAREEQRLAEEARRKMEMLKDARP